MVGVGVGALVTNQTLAVTVTLTWLLFIEAMVVSFASGLGRWLPGGAAGEGICAERGPFLGTVRTIAQPRPHVPSRAAACCFGPSALPRAIRGYERLRRMLSLKEVHG